MIWPSLLSNEKLYLEIRPRSLRVLYGEQTLAVPLARNGGGRLTPDCKDKVILGLRGLLKRKPWQPRIRAVCGIDARGVSLRRLSLPASSNDDVQRLIRLQIESQFPLPPEALAWGYSRAQQPIGNGHRDFIIAALKKEFLDDYTQVLTAAGILPVFTVAALARTRMCRNSSGSFALLDIGRRQSELIVFANGAPESIRILPWGGDAVTQAIERGLGITQDAAEKLKFQWDEGPVPNGDTGGKTEAAILAAMQELAAAIQANWSGHKLFLTGKGARHKDMPRQLETSLPSGTQCERIEAGSNNGATAALLGLKSSADSEASAPLILRSRDAKAADTQSRANRTPLQILLSGFDELRDMAAQPELRKFLKLAAILAACCLLLPLAQALILKPFLKRKLASIKTEQGRLTTIDRELEFLQFVKKTQPPYLDALTAVANSAPPGIHFDTVSMNRRGDLSLKGMMQNSQQVVDFRSRLVKSGFFSTVTVEEQTPSPDRQRLTVRLSAQWKPFGSRPLVKAEPLPAGYQPSGMPMGFPGMDGMPPMFPGGEMPPMPMRGPSATPSRMPSEIRKIDRPKGMPKNITIGPDGQIIVNSSSDSKSSGSDSKSSDSSGDKDSKPKND
jgi:Tfp pilus assembly PilM family ATPase/Tfp pilus assembly protein PilN